MNSVKTGRQGSFFGVQNDIRLLRRYRILGHVLFWLGYCLYEIVVWGMVDGEYHSRIVSTAIELPVKILATYFTLYVLIDKLLIQKRYTLFVVSLLASMLVTGILLRMIAYFVLYPMFYPKATGVALLFPPKIMITIFSLYSLVAIVASFHLIKHWYNHQQASLLLEQSRQQLEKEKLESELKLLKSQINPHFLFNTLNNLYSLALQKSSHTPQVVHKLSQLMSYMLYDSNQREVSLPKEIEYIRNYISLEKLRYEERLDVSLHIYNEISSIRIAPLLILPFVENSFKHGLSNELKRGWLRIEVSVHGNILNIKVENSKTQNEVNGRRQRVSGVGLNNVQKRLNLMYPGKHQLQLIDDDESYLVVLRLQWNETIRADLSHTKLNPATA